MRAARAQGGVLPLRQHDTNPSYIPFLSNMSNSTPVPDNKLLNAVKANCKFAYNNLNDLHAKVGDALKQLEQMVISNPDQTNLQELLLQQMGTFGRNKCVCTYNLPEDGPKPSPKSLKVQIDNSTLWAVQITAAKHVRVHLTEAGMRVFQALIPEEAINVKWYLRETYIPNTAPVPVLTEQQKQGNTEEWALKNAENLIAERKLTGWKVCISDKLTRSAGNCNYKTKTIKLSGPMLRSKYVTSEEILNTIKHEIAHAIAGYEAAHGPEWKTVAESLGCNAKRCHTMKF